MKRLRWLPAPWFFLLAWLVTLVLAEVLYRAIERPFLRLRDRLPQTATSKKAVTVSYPDVTCPRH